MRKCYGMSIISQRCLIYIIDNLCVNTNKSYVSYMYKFIYKGIYSIYLKTYDIAVIKTMWY